MHSLDTRSLEPIFPEVIGAVITINTQNNINICPINFQAISTKYENPLSVCIGLSNTCQTLKNLLTSGQFVYAYPSGEQLHDIIYCGTVSGKEIDKLQNTKLVFEDSDIVSPPNLSRAVINFECTLKHHYELVDFTIVIGEIVAIKEEKNKDRKKIYSLGGEQYGTVRIDQIIQEGR